MRYLIPPNSRRVGAALSILGGALYMLAFPGIDFWPLAFVAYVPLLLALEGQTPRRAAFFGWLFGLTACVLGFYWLVPMLRTFSGFSTPLCFLFSLILSGYQAGRGALLGFLNARMRARGVESSLAFLLAFAASEFLFPLLFPWYFAATVHKKAVLLQVADLGGPILVGCVLVSVNLFWFSVARFLLSHTRPPRLSSLLLLAPLAAASAYGMIQIARVGTRIEKAPRAEVGVVQGNMPLMAKRLDPDEGFRRHREMTAHLKGDGADFVVWSESAVAYHFPEERGRAAIEERVGRHVGLPAIFGGLLYRFEKDRAIFYNSAFSTSPSGAVTGRYDKHYLLAFGEYLPLGETFPVLYEWSPNSGHFSEGKTFDPLSIEVRGEKHVVAPLICYEDILPGFTQQMVKATGAELLVNIANDAWFGNTAELWQHLALSKFRAVEHHRYLVRSNNSGVSAVVNPVGDVVAMSQPFEKASFHTEVRWMSGTTVYGTVGDAPWMLVSAGAILLALRKKR